MNLDLAMNSFVISCSNFLIPILGEISHTPNLNYLEGYLLRVPNK